MEIVINIPEKVYSYVNTQWRDTPKNDSPISIMCNAVIDGTPLPKGHGRLIDADELIKNWYDEYIKFMTREEIESMDGIIENAPTIIGADKEANDG